MLHCLAVGSAVGSAVADRERERERDGVGGGGGGPFMQQLSMKSQIERERGDEHWT